MSFTDIIGNDSAKIRLQAALQHGHLAHALLLAGPEGVGKKRVALELAKRLNCQKPVSAEPCDACSSCRRIPQNLHPDVQVIAPTESVYIRIEQARYLRTEAYFRPLEGRRRVFIIDEADRMNKEAANAILKTLEEPPETTVIILITASPQALLPTIRSRCQLLPFSPLPLASISAWLQAQGKYAKATDAELTARLSLGSIGRALDIDLPAYKELRNEAFLAAENVVILKSFVEINKSALASGKDRKAFEAYLSVLLLLLRDTLVFKHLNTMDLVVNCDMRDALKRLAGKAPFELLSAFIDRLNQVRSALDRNINRQMALEALLLDLCNPFNLSRLKELA
ncbi:MAG: DNA polymerase III subunit delta' [Acidobacteria bacterium]|nr:DNA polymerase III subunit delta' [Acidobacteriota bacterium]MBI3654807.1 DNA polymerase III subunit delta' [Acidobacteriota bacterium]